MGKGNSPPARKLACLPADRQQVGFGQHLQQVFGLQRLDGGGQVRLLRAQKEC